MTPLERKTLMYSADSKCFVCKEHIATPEEATIEHIIPRSRGGSNSRTNLALSHRECNQAKGSDLVMDYNPEEYLRLLRQLKALLQEKDAKVRELNEALRVKSANLSRAGNESNFLRMRIKECFGVEGYMKIMAHVDCPGGFDIENFKKVHGLSAQDAYQPNGIMPEHSRGRS